VQHRRAAWMPVFRYHLSSLKHCCQQHENVPAGFSSFVLCIKLISLPNLQVQFSCFVNPRPAKAFDSPVSGQAGGIGDDSHILTFTTGERLNTLPTGFFFIR
jgi:hypothetical protein